MRLLVTGSRNWLGEAAWSREDDELLALRPTLIMHGGAQGADDCADEWGRIPWLNVEILRFRANWHDEGLAAGPIRNARMLADGKPDRGIAFGALWRFDHLKTKKWKRTGTGDMVARMLAARLPVRWIATPEALAIDLVQMPEAPRNSKAFFL